MAEEGIAGSAAPAESGGGEGSPAPETGGAGEAGGAASPWSFQYGDRAFSTPDEARQYFDSWNGRLRASAKELGAYRTENQRWADWYKNNQGLIDGALKAGQSSPELLDEVNWEYVQKLVEEGRGVDALRYLSWKNDTYLKARIEAIKQEMGAQVEPIQNRAMAQQTVISLLQAAQAATDDRGQPLYPEFQDDSSTYDGDFVNLFSQVFRDLPASVALDTDMHGVELAYLRAKQIEAARAGPARAATNAKAQQFVSQTRAQAQAIGGSVTGEPEEPGSDSELKRGMRKAAKYSSLGVLP